MANERSYLQIVGKLDTIAIDADVTAEANVAAALPVDDVTALVYKTGDSTAKVLIDASAVTTATSRTITMPDTNVTLADVAKVEFYVPVGASPPPNNAWPASPDDAGLGLEYAFAWHRDASVGSESLILIRHLLREVRDLGRVACEHSGLQVFGSDHHAAGRLAVFECMVFQHVLVPGVGRVLPTLVLALVVSAKVKEGQAPQIRESIAVIVNPDFVLGLGHTATSPRPPQNGQSTIFRW